MSNLREQIEAAWEARDGFSVASTPDDVRQSVIEAIDGLDNGSLRVAEKIGDAWQVNEWLKKAVLLSFRIRDNAPIDGGYTRFYDKVPLKYADMSDADLIAGGVRVVPSAIVRKGAYVAPGAVLMPSYVNIGAYVDSGAMIDTWATVGSCAQVGKNVHLSGGAGLGGVLEPLQASPTIIEDNCFIGARSEVVEGVIVGEGSVLSMGVFIGKSTPIYDREADDVIYGHVPPGSVIVPGSLPRDNGRYSITCAVIVKRVDAKTRGKVGINELLREAQDEAEKKLNTAMKSDPTLELAIDLIGRASVTPEDAGCQSLIAERLTTAGFHVTSLPFGDVSNLWATHSAKGSTNGSTAGSMPSAQPCFVFAGHTDVVPTGPIEQWTSDPFQPEIRQGRLYGRGATDMKSGVAAMVTAAEQFITDYPDHRGTIGFLITSDEEGPSIDGTRRVMQWLEENEQPIDYCIIGEASSVAQLGDRVMVGRRGSLSGCLTVRGIQGHVAYPQRADNPIHRMAPLLAALTAIEWDSGNDHFPPTGLQFTNIRGGTGASNVIPGSAAADFNLRYSTEQSVDDIKTRVEALLTEFDVDAQVDWNHSGSPFLTTQGALVDAVKASVVDITGLNTETSTAGGTSDGRFIAPSGAEVVELGPCNETAHKVDENIVVDDLPRLRQIYEQILRRLLSE